MLSLMFVLIPRAHASAVRINEVLELEPDITDTDKTNNISDKRGYIEFKNVTFSYPGAEQPAIENINFSAHPGEVTAIIGGTGSVKSTLMSLIPRFYDIGSGSILVDGIDVRSTTQKALRTKIGFVPQKAMTNLMKGRTSFVITHRLSTIREADLILVMNHGTIIEQGNHKELLEKGGFYADLYNSQFTGQTIENDII